MRIENKNILQDCKLLRASVLISLPRTGWRVQEITIIIINKWIKLVKINIEQHKIYFYSKTNNKMTIPLIMKMYMIITII